MADGERKERSGLARWLLGAEDGQWAAAAPAPTAAAAAAPAAAADPHNPKPKQRQLCLERKDKVCKKAPFVIFMLEKLKDAGCAIDLAKQFVCEQCPVNGAWDADRNEVVLCENSIYSDAHAADVITHELIHAFDHCRGKVDFRNIDHLACTEIRASSLSGDCFAWKENLDRLQFGFAKQHQRCVRRRAGNSLRAVLGVDQKQVDEALDRVWDVCFNDTEPFDRIP